MEGGEQVFIDLAPWGATVVSLVIAWLAHRRAKDAQGEQSKIDRTRLIQDGYQGLLDDMQTELNRLKTERENDKKEWEAREERLRSQVTDLGAKLQEERELRVRLEQRVEALTAELSNVEKRNGFYNEQGRQPDDGAADGGV